MENVLMNIGCSTNLLQMHCQLIVSLIKNTIEVEWSNDGLLTYFIL